METSLVPPRSGANAPDVCKGIWENDYELFKKAVDRGDSLTITATSKYPARLTAEPMYFACQSGDVRYVTALVEAGASPDSLCKGLNDTALMAAIRKGSEDIVKVLLDAGVDFLSDVDFIKPIDAAKRMGHLNIVMIIKEHMLEAKMAMENKGTNDDIVRLNTDLETAMGQREPLASVLAECEATLVRARTAYEQALLDKVETVETLESELESARKAVADAEQAYYDNEAKIQETKASLKFTEKSFSKQLLDAVAALDVDSMRNVSAGGSFEV